MLLKVSQRFPKTARLRKRAEFVKLSRTGAKLQSAHFVVIISANGRQENRLGVTVSAKVGNSVIRNRLKRRVRDYFRRHRAELPAASDILIIARTNAAGLEGNTIASELARTLAGQRKHRKL
jgi:ribonuclease P protein component